MPASAANTAIRIIQSEHSCLSAVIKGMRHFVRNIADGGKSPDLKVFRAMVFYICEYPEQIHHPKEDQHLFARLRRRTAEVDGTLAILESQHAEGERLVRKLEHALMRYELFGTTAFPQFAALVERYADTYFQHMEMEERIVLPAAKEYLAEEDWDAIAEAFSENRDPLASVGSEAEFDKLFTLITAITPAPIGVGPELG